MGSEIESDCEYDPTKDEASSSEESVAELKEPRTKRRKEYIKLEKNMDDNSMDHYKNRIMNLGDNEDLIPVPNHKQTTEWKIEEKIWLKLYKYQQKGVKWLQNLYEQKVGGILADEMGLGKTIQAITFLRSIQETGNYHASLGCKGLGRTLILCPASVIQQWVKEFNQWFPMCRVFVMHSTSSTGWNEDVIKKLGNRKMEYPNGCVVLTSYKTYVLRSSDFNRIIWHLVLLDEGHKIKNLETKNCQTIRNVITPYRFILTGTPIQNNLLELYSLIDFIYPGKLGSIDTFKTTIVNPIQEGSFLHSRPQSKENAYQCALILQYVLFSLKDFEFILDFDNSSSLYKIIQFSREAVKPYILRRLKSDPELNLHLPEKNEHILFVRLTEKQRKVYEEFLKSEEVQSILHGRREAFSGIIKMFHICNHPAIFAKISIGSPEYGRFSLSGKLHVLKRMLHQWSTESSLMKVLIFTQSIAVLELLDAFCRKRNYNCLQMSGNTPIGQRQSIVEKFNTNPEISVFLLTTKVGGVGLNLTAANKVIIFDPDWNPSTDDQAKERAWRIGQNRDVTIYRLICSGTIEEKAYQRQIHKQALATRVLENADAKQIIPKETLKDLFCLAPKEAIGTDTGYLVGEVVPREKSQVSTNPVDENRKKKKRIKSKDLSQFEDKKALASLFEGDMLVSIISHENAVKNEQDKMILKVNARHSALDAAKHLIHVEGRPSKDWEQKFAASLTGEEKKDVDEQAEPTNSFWSAVHKNLKKNEGKNELNESVQKAKDIRMAFLANNGKLTLEKIEKYFKPNTLEGIELYFFKEMLGTLSRFNTEENVFVIKKKYK